MKNLKKEIRLLFLFISIFIVLFFLMSDEQIALRLKSIVITILITVLLVFYILNEIRKRRDRKLDIPVEDEMSKRQKLVAGNKAFHLSMILWLIIFAINSQFDTNETMLGIGILGSALIYGVYLWIYKLKGTSDEE